MCNLYKRFRLVAFVISNIIGASFWTWLQKLRSQQENATWRERDENIKIRLNAPKYGKNSSRKHYWHGMSKYFNKNVPKPEICLRSKRNKKKIVGRSHQRNEQNKTHIRNFVCTLKTRFTCCGLKEMTIHWMEVNIFDVKKSTNLWELSLLRTIEHHIYRTSSQMLRLTCVNSEQMEKLREERKEKHQKNPLSCVFKEKYYGYITAKTIEVINLIRNRIGEKKSGSSFIHTSFHLRSCHKRDRCVA